MKKNKKAVGSKEDMNDYSSNLNQFKKSKITFDKGGIWKPISPPIKDSAGKKYTCDSKEGTFIYFNKRLFITFKWRFI